MKLLFAYFDFSDKKDGSSAYRGLGQCKLNFSTTHDYDVSRRESNKTATHPYTYTLSREKKQKPDLLPKDFWGDRIYNITALVGSNGTGKSSLLHSLIKTVVNGLSPNAPFLLVMQKTRSEEIFVYCGGGILENVSLHIQMESFSATPKIYH